MAESFRSGLEAVSKGQIKAAKHRGSVKGPCSSRGFLPQAIAIAVPSIGANMIFLLKETSVFSAVALADLMYVAKDLIGIYYETDEALTPFSLELFGNPRPRRPFSSLYWKGGYAMASGAALLANHTWTRHGNDAGVTILVSILSVALSIVFGLIFGWIMTKEIRNYSSRQQALSGIYAAYAPARAPLYRLSAWRALNVHISRLSAAIIVFTQGTAEMGGFGARGHLFYSKHQYETAASIGLTRLQTMGYIILPQALRRLIPQAMNLVTRMIKTTSLIALIGVIEVIKTGQQIIEATRLEIPTAALWIYGVIFILYFIICYPLSTLAGKRWNKKWKEA